MALIVKDRVREITSTTGTGTITLTAAVVGFQSFSVIGDGNQTYYTIVDAATGAFEVGIGTYTASGTTLSRDTVLESSNANALVSFSSGTKDVFVTYPADRSVSQADIGTEPNEIPLNQYLGSLAYQDLESVTIDGGVATLDTATITSIQNDTAISNVEPSLMLNFAAVKKLDPRITYARASTATYYDGVTNSKAEENLVLYSQEFDNAYWTKSSATVTANTEVAPDGTTTADTLTVSGQYGGIYRFVSLQAGATYTLSLWAKENTGSNAYSVQDNDGGAGTIGTFTPTSTWTRFSFTFTAVLASFTLFIAQDRNASGFGSFFLWGAQLEARSAPTAYTATTTQPITNYIPALQTAASGVARFDHDPTTTESLGLLIEEQRTNLVLYSGEFDNGNWVKSNATVVANQVVAPDGTLTADVLTNDSTSGEHRAYQTHSAASANVTQSVYAKAGTASFISINGGSTGIAYAVFDLSTGIVSTSGNGVGSIIPVGNGWFRCVVNPTGATVINNLVISIGETAAQAVPQTNYVGTGKTVYLWGAQAEIGGFSTSYIPTVASQVTRSADSASMTGANLFSWFNPSQGTLYAEANHIVGVNQNAYFAQIAGTGSGTGYGESIAVGKFDSSAIGSGQRIKGIVYVINSINANLVTASNITTSPVKVSLGYKVNDFAASIDGAASLTDTSGVLPVINSVGVFSIGSIRGGGLYINSTIKKLAYYPARLSNAELQEMTEQ